MTKNKFCTTLPQNIIFLSYISFLFFLHEEFLFPPDSLRSYVYLIVSEYSVFFPHIFSTLILMMVSFPLNKPLLLFLIGRCRLFVQIRVFSCVCLHDTSTLERVILCLLTKLDHTSGSFMPCPLRPLPLLSSD